MALPPIKGKPPPPVSERPKCPTCNKPLRPYFDWEWGKVDGREQCVARTWDGHSYHGYRNTFCTNACAMRFGYHAHKAGYRTTAVHAQARRTGVRP